MCQMLNQENIKSTDRYFLEAVREKISAVRLLNGLFECQGYLWRHKKSMRDKLEAYLIHHQLFTKEELAKLKIKD